MKTSYTLAILAALVLAACATSGRSEADAASAQYAAPAAAANRGSTADLLGRGYAAIRANRLDEAEALLQQARAQSPNDPYVLLNLGVVYQTKRQVRLAEQYYNDTIRVSANTPQDASVLASGEIAVNSTPALIARRNLALIK